MTSRDPLRADDGVFDRTLSTALRASVAGERPAPGARDALLRAAAQRRRAGQRVVYVEPSGEPRLEATDISRDWLTRSVSISPSAVLALHAQILGLRVVQ